MNPEEKPLALDFGCGNSKLTDDRYRVIGVDAHAGESVDVICDFDQTQKLPFPDNHFEYIYMSHILEHVAEPRALLLEAFRVARRDTSILVRVPHRSNRWACELNHRRYFNYFSLDCMILEGGNSAETQRCFEFKRRELKITPRFVKKQHWLKAARDRFIEGWANRYPAQYEGGLYTFFPAYEIIFDLGVLK